ncbi:AI-2E family transporter, partial [Lactobacillus salivarius]|nr:AI-2E family transporter [Ligilactobacillus salivarius]
MPNKKNLMFWSLEILIVATLIWVCMKINFVFQPVVAFFSTLFIPVIISGFLYYMLLPLVKLLMKVKIGKFKINRTGAVAIVFIAVFAIIAMSIAFLLPKIIVQ